jgi:hypothetical protein
MGAACMFKSKGDNLLLMERKGSFGIPGGYCYDDDDDYYYYYYYCYCCYCPTALCWPLAAFSVS